MSARWLTLFGERYADFARDLAALLAATSDHGWFSEVQHPVTVTVWRAAAKT